MLNKWWKTLKKIFGKVQGLLNTASRKHIKVLIGDWDANDQWNGGIGIIDGFELG